jgi:hypothetical protein
MAKQKLAMEGRWDELKKWQSELDKGVLFNKPLIK